MPGLTVTTAAIGHTGYRHQLDRARRMLDRLHEATGSLEPVLEFNEYYFQDDMWSFFQACWHIKDWVRHDPLVPDAVKAAINTQVESNPTLMICSDVCNGTKHLKLTSPRVGARFESTETTHQQGILLNADCWIEDGNGNRIEGKKLAQQCLAEREKILTGHNLAVSSLA